MKKLLIGVALGALIGVAQAQQPVTGPLPLGPSGSTPLVAGVSATANQVVATLTGTAGQWTYLCGFVATSTGVAAAAAANGFISGTAGTNAASGLGVLPFQFGFVTGQSVLGMTLGPGCIVAARQGGSIQITIPSGGTGATTALDVWGYSL